MSTRFACLLRNACERWIDGSEERRLYTTEKFLISHPLHQLGLNNLRLFLPRFSSILLLLSTFKSNLLFQRSFITDSRPLTRIFILNYTSKNLSEIWKIELKGLLEFSKCFFLVVRKVISLCKKNVFIQIALIKGLRDWIVIQ